MKNLQDLSVVICGEAGQGVQTVEEVLTRVLKRSGFHVFASREYMSRVRGGNNSSALRVASQPVDGTTERIDLLLLLGGTVRPNIRSSISDGTVILADEKLLPQFENLPGRYVACSFAQIGKEAGHAVYANAVAAGVVLGLVEASEEETAAFFTKEFARKGDEVVQANVTASHSGRAVAKQLRNDFPYLPRPEKGHTEGRIVADGVKAVSLGALAAGCDFVTAYPMAPATGVLGFAAKQAANLGLVVEQTEDEISAINMAVGASFAGATPLVTTSGGGFSLMYEGISLAGVAETPLVVHLAQRPGPATGMATRTEQGDLNLALHAGHGEFPRLVTAPGTVEEAFSVTAQTVERAVACQVPAIVLTDQYLLNVTRDVEPFDVGAVNSDKHLVQSHENYRRYEITDSGISPRSVPGFGAGLVGGDSHEHDEKGHVFEDFDLRVRMSEKRFRKLDELRCMTIPSPLEGPRGWRDLVICWGSLYPIVKEAFEGLERTDAALLHVVQIWPLGDDVQAAVKQAERIFFVEGNHDGQLEGLIRRETGRGADGHLRHWSGLQLTVETTRRGLAELLDGKEASS